MTESLLIFFIFSSANSLFAYIGPGLAGGGEVAAIFGIITAFFRTMGNYFLVIL